MDIATKLPRAKTLKQALDQVEMLWALVAETRKTIDQQAQVIVEQTEKIRHLNEQLNDRRNAHSANSSSPPSRDAEWQREHRREVRKRHKTGKPKGAQTSHKKHERRLLDTHEVDDIQHYLPPINCTRCGATAVLDAEPYLRHQVFDLPQVSYTVTEHQLHSATCGQCQHRTVAQRPSYVPQGQMGPGLIATIGLLSGQFRLSIRQTQSYLKEAWQLDFSTGCISQAQGKLSNMLGDVYRHIGEFVRDSEVAHADETRHWRNTQGYWLWVLQCKNAVYFMTHYSRAKQAANELLGRFKGYLVTDRYAGYNDYDANKRQVCWAHILRNITGIAERSGEAGKLGQRLLLIAHSVFRLEHWRQKQGKDRADIQFQKRAKRLRKSWLNTLSQCCEEGRPKRVRNMCSRLQKDDELLWRFIESDVIALTNNSAEQALRGYVIWRKTSYSSKSAQGDQFRPQILSVLQTAHKLGLNKMQILRQICTEAMATGVVKYRLPLSRLISR